MREKSPERTPSLKRSTCESRISWLSDFGRLPLGGIRARSGGAVELRPTVERLLRIFQFARRPAPGLARGPPQCAAVREGQLPRVRPALVHRVQPGGRILVRHPTGEEDD